MNTTFEMFGVECGTGWSSIINPLIKECNDKGIVITQIKEKFGTLRFYVAEASDEMREKIEKAEDMSSKVCEICGKEGSLGKRHGWLKTLCPEHKKEHHYEEHEIVNV